MRVFNMDEKGFILSPKNEVVLAKRGQRAVYNRSQNDEKECVTALLGGNAAGIQTPPMLVYAYKRMPSNILLNLPADWSVGISDNGWQTQNTFMDYISNVFCKWLTESNIKLPVILFIDGHKSHISLTLSEFCSAHQIELVALYPNATHIIQPMDVVVFKPLGAAWEIKLKDWKINHEFAKIDKKDIAPILSESIKAVDYAGLLQTGFKRCGLFPFDVANINFSRLLPPTTNDISEDQLLNDDDSTEPNPVESKQRVLDKLKIFEELIEPTVLNMFRSCRGDWNGPIEYTALYTLWWKLYTDTTAFISMEDEEAIMIIDVETSNSEMCAPSNERQHNTEVFIVGDNGQLLNCDGTQVIVFGDNEVVVDDMADSITDTIVPPDAIIPLDMIVPADTIVPLIEECDSMVIQNSAIGCDRSMKLNMESIFDQKPLEIDVSGQGQSQIPMSDDPKEMSIDDNSLIEMNIEDDKNTKADPTILTKHIQSKMADTQSFDEVAFKKSFVVPKPKESKKKKNVQKERVSTVITSEAWKESEQKKLREKQRVEAEKEARKIERERKKILAAELKVEKEIAKEKKKIEKAEKDAQKKKTRKGTKKSV
ncbi:uncharacterized protein LOC119082540 [Bradysia coprophila]|uniref:uncharacterized protein LOC119082540 n=1 Tax=Bradysia coprophila TaxID=38358 RepID=UPI00187DCE54|nr:uncharacterized protein LOC119082540 [Bradysia coprophila]